MKSPDPRRTLWPYRTELERQLETVLRDDPPWPHSEEELQAANPHLHLLMTVVGPGNRARRHYADGSTLDVLRWAPEGITRCQVTDGCGEALDFDDVAGCLICPAHGPVSADGGLSTRMRGARLSWADLLGDVAGDPAGGDEPLPF